MSNLVLGEITYANTGTFPNSLGTLSSSVSADRGAFAAGPTPTDLGNGSFSLDLDLVTGNFVNIVVSSDVAGTTTWVYSGWLVTFPTVVAAANPTDLDDGKKGAWCSKTLKWIPRSRLKFWQGRPYLDVVCPTGRPGPEALTPPPGILVIAPDDP